MKEIGSGRGGGGLWTHQWIWKHRHSRPSRTTAKTWMHSSTMRAIRCSDGLLVGGGGGCLPKRGVSAEGVCIPACTEADTLPLWTEWLTDRCKNITFPQLRLRTVTETCVLFLDLKQVININCPPKHILEMQDYDLAPQWSMLLSWFYFAHKYSADVTPAEF